MSKTKNIITLSAGQAINTGINILFLPFLARTLPYEVYGTYGQMILLVDFFTIFFTLGLDQIIYSFLEKKDLSTSKVFTQHIVSGLMSGIIVCVLILLLASLFAVYFQNSLLKEYLMLYSFSAVFQIANAVIFAFLIQQQKVVYRMFLFVSVNIIKVIVFFISVQYFHTIIYGILGMVILSALQFLVGLWLTRNNISPYFSYKLYKEQLKLGFPISLSAFSVIAFYYIDSIMISKLLSVKDYAIYRNGAIEIPFLTIFLRSVSAIVFPDIVKLSENKQWEALTKLKRHIISHSALIMFPAIFFVLFNSKEIITWYLGEKYSDSSIIFFAYSITFCLRVINYYEILVANKKSYSVVLITLLVIPINILLDYFLIKKWGLLGAGITHFITFFIYATLLLQKNIRVLQTTFFQLIEWKKILSMTSLCLIVLILLNSMLPETRSIWHLGLYALLFFIPTYVLMFLLKFFDGVILQKILPKYILKKLERILR